MKTSAAMVGLALAIAAMPPAASSEELQVRQQNGMSYVSGGIGDAEQARLKRMAERFNLRVTMATNSGAYMGATLVHIEKSSGEKVAEIETRGPILLAEVPPGKYRIRVDEADLHTSRSVSVKSDQQAHVMFRWDENLARQARRAGIARQRAGDAPRQEVRERQARR